MRIIAGEFRNRKILAPEGLATRPIHDRAREALFNILANEVPDSLFLDLYAGSGSVGLEALSRGAARVTFVDAGAPAIAAIQQNIRDLDVRERTQVIQGKVETVVDRLIGERDYFDIVFMGPPYKEIIRERVFESLTHLGEPLVIVQHHPKYPNYLMSDGWKVLQSRKYGINALTFLVHGEPEEREVEGIL